MTTDYFETLARHTTMLHLEHLGYATVPVKPEVAQELKAEFQEWLNRTSDLYPGQKLITKHGILKNYGIGQTSFMYKARLHTARVFRMLYRTQDIVMSMDGACYYGPNSKPARPWVHRDQRTNLNDFKCYQAVLELDPNLDSGMGGLMVVPGSHKINLGAYDSGNKDWFKIPKEMMVGQDLVTLRCGTPALHIWDSRLWHQNKPPQVGQCRYALYISAQPRPENYWKTSLPIKRKQFVDLGHTTSHWSIRGAKNPESMWRLENQGYLDPKIRISSYKPSSTELELVGAQYDIEPINKV